MPLAAVTLAIVGVNAVGAIFGQLGWRHAGLTLLYLNWLLIPLTLLGILWLLHRISFTVSNHFWDTVIPGLTFEIREALYDNEHYSQLVSEYEKELRASGLVHKSAADLFNMDRIQPVRISLSRSGTITDVNLPALKELASCLQAVCTSFDPALTLAPGDTTYFRSQLGETTPRCALLLRAGRDDAGHLRTTLPDLTQEIPKIQKHLDAVFVIGKTKPHDVFDAISGFDKKLAAEAPFLPADELKEILDRQIDLIELRMAYKQRAGGFTFYRNRLSEPLNWSYSELAHRIGAKGDEDQVVALIWFAYHAMELAIKYQDPDLLRRAGSVLEILYHRARRRKRIADRIAEEIDNRLGGILVHFTHTQWNRRSSVDSDRITQEMPLVTAALAWTVQLIGAAVEADRTDDAAKFLERMWHWDSDSQRDTRHARHGLEGTVPSVMREVYDLHSAATIVIAAWCLHLIKEGKPGHDAAGGIFSKCAAELGGREDILRVWELVSAEQGYGDTPASCFGAKHWAVAVSTRSGMPTLTRGKPDQWCDDGLLALLLCKPSVPKRQLTDHFDKPPRSLSFSLSELESRCRRLLVDEGVRNILKILPESVDATVEEVVALLEDRADKYRQAAESVEEQEDPG